MTTSIYEAFAERGGTVVLGYGDAVWGAIRRGDGSRDDDAEDAAAAEAGYARVRGPYGDYFSPVAGESSR